MPHLLTVAGEATARSLTLTYALKKIKIPIVNKSIHNYCITYLYKKCLLIKVSACLDVCIHEVTLIAT